MEPGGGAFGMEDAVLEGLGELNMRRSSGDGKKFALKPYPAIAVRGY
jgi:hypothetical protein